MYRRLQYVDNVDTGLSNRQPPSCPIPCVIVDKDFIGPRSSLASRLFSSWHGWHFAVTLDRGSTIRKIIFNPADGSFLFSAPFKPRYQYDDGNRQYTNDQTGDVTLAVVWSIRNGVKDERPPGDKCKIKAILRSVSTPEHIDIEVY